MEKSCKQNEGWDYDDLDCPEYGETITPPNQVLEEENYGKKEKMDIFRREDLNR